MNQSLSAPREYGLDWLRVIAFAILIGYHTGMFFVPWDWHVKNPETSDTLTWFMLFFNRWRLPLLFLISGAGVAFALRRRSLAGFAGERMRRLFLPLVFGMLVVVPPQIYFERLTQGVTFATYFDFWKTVFAFQSYPQGSLSWHHLWFVAYIWVFSLVCIPLFGGLKSERGQRAVDALARLCEKPGAIYLIALPNLVIAFWLGPRWPTTHNLVADWANLTGSLLTFLWGFIICGNGRFFDLIVRKRHGLLTFAIVMTVLFYGYRVAPFREALTAMQRMSASMLIESFMGFGWVLALLGWSRVKLNRDSPLLRYATEAVYPFYIVHQTITVTIAFYMIPWTAPVAVKFPLLAAGTFLGSWLVFELTRRHPLTRVLFGMKARRPSPTSLPSPRATASAPAGHSL